MEVILNLNRFIFQVQVKYENAVNVFWYIKCCDACILVKHHLVLEVCLSRKPVTTRDTERENIVNLEAFVNLRVTFSIKLKIWH